MIETKLQASLTFDALPADRSQTGSWAPRQAPAGEDGRYACLAIEWQWPRADSHRFLVTDESVSAFSPCSANDIGRPRMTMAIG